MKIDVRLKIFYLLAVSIGVFFISDLKWLAGVLLLQIAFWPLFGLEFVHLFRSLRGLVVLFLLIMLSFLLFPDNLPEDAYYKITVFGAQFRLDLNSIIDGTVMSLRIMSIVLASLLARSGGAPGDFMRGLKTFHFPEFMALTVDTSLSLIDFTEKKPGQGKKGGAGRERIPFRQFLTRENNPLVGMVKQSLKSSQDYAERAGYQGDLKKLKDAGIISGLAALTMSIKFLKIMPKIPVLPGHKGLVIIPLYILGAELTNSPFGATYLGITTGIIAFLFGEGRFGIFEIFKYVTAGMAADALLPFLKKISRNPNVIHYTILGIVVAVARFSTIVIVALIIGAPAGFFALLAPIGVVHVIFGGMSGPVSFLLIKAIKK